MRRYGKNTDEDDIRSRPNPKGNRPRTNIRPKHEEAVEGMILTVDRGRLTCLVEDRVVMAMKARELGRKAAVVGDRVAIVGDLSGQKDTLARIVRIEPRTGCVEAVARLDHLLDRMTIEERLYLQGNDNFVLNGIAYDARRKSFYVTGKNWINIFTGRFVDQ